LFTVRITWDKKIKFVKIKRFICKPDGTYRIYPALTKKLLGPETFLKSQQALSYSRNSPNFISLPHSKQPTTCPCPRPDLSSPCPNPRPEDIF
jgi:hypothetical protein